MGTGHLIPTHSTIKFAGGAKIGLPYEMCHVGVQVEGAIPLRGTNWLYIANGGTGRYSYYHA